MSSFYDRIKETIEHTLDERDAVRLWNDLCERDGMDFLYPMSEFDEQQAIMGNKTYREVKSSLGKDFDEHAKYFKFHGDGLAYSYDNYRDAIDFDYLAQAYISSDGFRFSPVPDLTKLFSDETFQNEMFDVVDNLSREAFDYILDVMTKYGFNMEYYIDDIIDGLTVAKNEGRFDFVYMLPSPVQSKFFEFCYANENYLKSNIGKNGVVPVSEALLNAGFKSSVKLKNTGIYSCRDKDGYFHQFKVKSNGNVLKSVEPFTPGVSR